MANVSFRSTTEHAARLTWRSAKPSWATGPPRTAPLTRRGAGAGGEGWHRRHPGVQFRAARCHQRAGGRCQGRGRPRRRPRRPSPRSAAENARDLADAQKDLTRALEDQAQAAQQSAQTVDKYAEALAKLSPSAATFVRQMVAMKDRFTEFKKAVQEPFFAAFNEPFFQMVDVILPVLQAGLAKTSESWAPRWAARKCHRG